MPTCALCSTYVKVDAICTTMPGIWVAIPLILNHTYIRQCILGRVFSCMYGGGCTYLVICSVIMY